MWFRTLYSSLTLHLLQRRRNRRSKSASRLCFEALEDRSVLAFLVPVEYPRGSEAMVSYDFNHDGRLDLATAGGVLLGNGDTTFQSAQILPFLGGAGSLAAGDFNGDGNADLAGPTRFLLGNGDGTFGQPLELGGWGSNVASGDLNGDGYDDLVRTHSESNADWSMGYIGVMLGNSDGTFASLWSVETTGQGSIALADFDSDGTLDVSIPDAGNVAVWLGNGDGTLQLPVSYGAANASYVAVADFNGDNRPDLATADGYPFAQVCILLGNGDGTLQAAQVYGNGTSLFNVGSAAGDFNGDGKDDLAVMHDDSLGGSVSVLLGNGDGTLERPTTFHTGFTWGLTVEDLNSDGFSDLAGTTGIAVKVLANDANWPPIGAPSLAIDNATITEGNSGTRVVTFTLTLSKAYGQTVTVAYATANSTASAGSDYQSVFNTLTIPAGQTTGTIIVPVIGDRSAEGNETFFVNLNASTIATIADGQGTGTIMDDEPRISISDVTMGEGKKGQSTFFTFTVTLSAAYDQPVAMSYRTVDGSAKTSDNDYVAKSGALTFAPGELVKTITIEVKGDSKKEANETFYLDLFGLTSNAQFTKNRGIGTILNDD